ncbi:hypothetical protein SALBM217S_09084 [Streptomyces griseoloalbus]
MRITSGVWTRSGARKLTPTGVIGHSFTQAVAWHRGGAGGGLAGLGLEVGGLHSIKLAGQALRLVIAWMWSIGWSGSYMEWISEDRRLWPSGCRTRMSASWSREQMSVSSRAMTTASPASRSTLRRPWVRTARAIALASEASSRV